MSSDRKSYKLQIYEAAEASDDALLEKLLTALQHQQGVVERKLLEYRDKDGCTPLIVAAANNCLTCVRLLLEHGAKVNAMSAGEEGGTALHHAARMGGEYGAVCKLLYAKGANPFLADCRGRTPLDEAILAGQPAAEEFGASTSTSTGILNHASKLHERIAQEAMQSGWQEFVETILERAPLRQYRAAIMSDGGREGPGRGGEAQEGGRGGGRGGPGRGGEAHEGGRGGGRRRRNRAVSTTPPQMVEDEERQKACVICLSAPKTIGLKHGYDVHKCVCGECAKDLVVGTTPCPMCRRIVEGMLVIND